MQNDSTALIYLTQPCVAGSLPHEPLLEREEGRDLDEGGTVIKRISENIKRLRSTTVSQWWLASMGQWCSEAGAGVEQARRCGMFGRIRPHHVLFSISNGKKKST
jgi:hypothetical protein